MRVVSHEASGCSLIRVVSHLGVLSLGWSHQGGLLLGWSLISSGWSPIRVVSQCSL